MVPAPRLISLLAVSLLGCAAAATAAEPVTQVRLYALNCGDMTAKNLGMFSDTGEYDGRSGEVISPCFVIRHPKGTLLWNTGIGDEVAAMPQGGTLGGGAFTTHLKATLVEQLKQIGLSAADIDFVAFSHFHGDHTGNAKNFPGATWIVNKAEVDAANATPPLVNVSAQFQQALGSAKQEVIRNDHDVFGDGSVRILKAPGHTPGHQALELKLKSGTVVLSGDLYHMRDNRKFHRVPGNNYSRADTLASFDRIDTIVKNTQARFIIEHDRADFATLPKFPAYLE
ncbi:MAG TPA: N-acyl homoserine lactonase family protein [Povalibacter sp.]|nr:N-acyl homoserine lactonase family protein [Povalibacter sp.]